MTIVYYIKRASLVIFYIPLTVNKSLGKTSTNNVLVLS